VPWVFRHFWQMAKSTKALNCDLRNLLVISEWWSSRIPRCGIRLIYLIFFFLLIFMEKYF
jgi:hypothetical protein